MLGYIPMCKKKYFIICCNSIDGLQSVELCKDKEEAREKLENYYIAANRDPENKEVSYTLNSLHIVTNEWQDDIWYDIVEKNIPVA